MKSIATYFVCIFTFFLSAATVAHEVTPEDILSGKYINLLANNPDYTPNIDKYNHALRIRKSSYKKLDSLFAIETLPLWPVEERKKLKAILILAKNDTSGDVYEHLKTFGAEYAFTLNKIIDLRTVYALERGIVVAGNDIKEIEGWAAILAEAARYFKEDFVNGKLIKDTFYYSAVTDIEKELQEISSKYKDNIDVFIESNLYPRPFYYRWARYYNSLKLTPERERLLRKLEEKFGKVPYLKR